MTKIQLKFLQNRKGRINDEKEEQTGVNPLNVTYTK